jgi:uncharacterized protein (DUF1015 family)
MGTHRQLGLVLLASCADYEAGIVRKHEFTRPDKEADRVRHIDTLNTQTGPVLLTYRAHPALDALFRRISEAPPVVDFTAVDGIQHRCWVVEREEDNAWVAEVFSKEIPLLYIADGHHRSAAAALVAKARREADPTLSADDPSQFFLGVAFAHDQMQILPYHRFVFDLGEQSSKEFWEKLNASFSVAPLEDADIPRFSPPAPRTFDMRFQGRWWRLRLREHLGQEDDPVARLDVSLLQTHLLSAILAIHDPRRDQRIAFVGGIRGYKGLEALCERHPDGLAIACYPTSMEELLAVADAGQIMPPKSTWFEPKLRSGLFVYPLQAD